MTKQSKIIPLNRVEGDLEIHLEIEDDLVTEARCAGTMYRGFETLLIGRSPLDSLVITPRVCGICSTAHLLAAAKALDMALGVHVPGNARRVRNAALMVEQIQNDLRHSFLLFMPDLARPAQAGTAVYEEAVRRYTPLKGETSFQCIQETKKILEIIAILGGQWPHSSFMVPGGVVSLPSDTDINLSLSLLSSFWQWYERRILGCSLERWQQVKSIPGLEAWLDESPDHSQSDLGFFIRASRVIGLDKIGRGCGNFLSCGSLPIPDGTEVACLNEGKYFFPSGFFRGADLLPFDQAGITEDITSSFFKDQPDPCHPFEGVTRPDRPRKTDGKYSWAKAPRYEGLPAETGPLAGLAMAADPLILDLLKHGGPSVFLRQFARIIRPALILPTLECWLREIVTSGDDFFQNYTQPEICSGYGLTEAHRGALGHWLKIEDEKIAHYQIITPTAWNASPRDGRGRRGPMEEALVGTNIEDSPAAVEHIVRSFDPCLVCTVHAIDLRAGNRYNYRM